MIEFCPSSGTIPNYSSICSLMKYQGEFLVLSKEMNLFEGKYTIYKFVYVSMFVDVRRGERETYKTPLWIPENEYTNLFNRTGQTADDGGRLKVIFDFILTSSTFLKSAQSTRLVATTSVAPPESKRRYSNSGGPAPVNKKKMVSGDNAKL